jgi:hypothetical protein
MTISPQGIVRKANQIWQGIEYDKLYTFNFFRKVFHCANTTIMCRVLRILESQKLIGKVKVAGRMENKAGVFTYYFKTNPENYEERVKHWEEVFIKNGFKIVKPRAHDI